MLARVFSGAIVGLDSVPIEVEVDIASQGLPSFTLVGLPDKAIEEAKERVRSAIRNSGADFPAKRITVNLAPADLPKEGPAYDLPIALGILLASEQIKADLSKTLVIGELALDGRVRGTHGILPHVLMAKKHHFTEVVLPMENAKEASVVDNITITPVSTLLVLLRHLDGTSAIEQFPHTPFDGHSDEYPYEFDMKDIRGQQQAKRALEIAAAGGHNILLKGPPGAGKTLLARTLPSILPSLTFNEALEVTKIYSIAGLLNNEHIVTKRPFRSPHHTTSLVGIIGGSTNPRPGELTLAHRGILFLDEFPEFPRNILEALRQPIEDGMVSIARANGKITFPTHCMLVAAHNPCPCGYLGDKSHACNCTAAHILRYQKKLSGPILDRIDIHLDVPAVKTDVLSQHATDAEPSHIIRKRVQAAREKQKQRFSSLPLTNNAEMATKHIKEFCPLSEECLSLMRLAITSMHLSARSYYRTIKLARTIADIEGSDAITAAHIAESLQYRPKAESQN